MDFREAYLNLIQQLKSEENKTKDNLESGSTDEHITSTSVSYSGISLTDFLRGLKTAVCDKQFDVVTINSFNELIKQTGFPLNPDYIIGLTTYEITDDNTPVRIDDTLMDTESFMKAQIKYLETILTCDRVFIDPISQEPLQIDQHLAPLELVESNEWNDLLQTEADMDEEDEKRTRLERMGVTSNNTYFEDAIEFLSNSVERPLKYLILGSAACGKTCMMKLLCYKSAQNAYKNSSDSNSHDLIPLLVPLANIPFESDDGVPFKIKCIRASADTFNKGLKYSADVERFLLNVWQSGRLLLLLDGLDEGGENRGRLEKLICGLNFRELGGMITTSRVSGFEQDEAKILFDSFKIARIKPLSYQVQKHIAIRRGIKESKFFQALHKYKELAKIPLLLSLMIQEFKLHKDLPEIRAVLYDHACETMILIYISRFRPHTTKQERKDLFEMLFAIACILHEDTKRYFTSGYIEKHLQEIVQTDEHLASAMIGNSSSNDSSISEPSRNVYETWKAFQRDIDEGHFPLIIRLGSNYLFAHLSFQEYFVAKVWSDPTRVSTIREQKKGRLSFLVRKKEVLPIVFSNETKKLIVDPWFRETFLLCAGSMSQEDFSQFITYLYDNFKKSSAIDNLLLQMIRTERPTEEREYYSEIERNITTQKKLKIMIMDGLIHDSALLRDMTTKRVALYESDLNNVISYLLKVITKNKDKTKAAAQSLIEIFQQIKDDKEGIRYKTAKKLIESIPDKQWKIGEASVTALLGICEKEDPKINKKLWALMTKPPIEAQVRACFAVSLLAKKGDSKFINKLMELLLSDAVKEGAGIEKMVESLTNISVKGDESILSQIRSNIKQTQSKAVRHGLIIALGRISEIGDKHTIKLLVQILSKEKTPETLVCVVEALKMVCEKRDHSIISIALKLLKDHIAFRPDKSIREDYEEYEASFNELNHKIMELVQVVLLGRDSHSKKEKDIPPSKILTEFLHKDSDLKKLFYDLIDTMFALAVTADLEIRKTTILAMSSLVNHHDTELIAFIFEKIRGDLLRNIMIEDKAMEINTAIFVVGVVFAHTDNNEACNILLELIDSNSSNSYLLGEIFFSIGNVAPRNDLFIINILLKYLAITKDNQMEEKELWKLKAKIVLSLENLCSRDDKNNEKYVTTIVQLLETCPPKFSHLFRPQCIKVIGKLGKRGDKELISKLLLLANEKDIFIRKAIANSLGNISEKANKNVVRTLKDCLDDENAEVRQEAIESLEKVADLEQLVSSLKANSSDVIRTYLFAMIIGQIRERRQENTKFCMDSKQVKHLEMQNCTEARFIIMENYSV